MTLTRGLLGSTVPAGGTTLKPLALLLGGCILASCSAAPQSATATPAPTEDPRIADLTARLGAAETDLAWYRTQLASAQQDARDARARADQLQCCGTFPMWTLPAVIPAGTVHAAGLPDTFTATVRFKTDRPVRAWIMTFGELARYMNGQPFTATMSFGTTTEVDVVFHEAEGCAIYALVIEASADTLVTPDIWITRHLSRPTGACR